MPQCFPITERIAPEHRLCPCLQHGSPGGLTNGKYPPSPVIPKGGVFKHAFDIWPMSKVYNNGQISTTCAAECRENGGNAGVCRQGVRAGKSGCSGLWLGSHEVGGRQCAGFPVAGDAHVRGRTKVSMRNTKGRGAGQLSALKVYSPFFPLISYAIVQTRMSELIIIFMSIIFFSSPFYETRKFVSHIITLT